MSQTMMPVWDVDRRSNLQRLRERVRELVDVAEAYGESSLGREIQAAWDGWIAMEEVWSEIRSLGAAHTKGGPVEAAI